MVNKTLAVDFTTVVRPVSAAQKNMEYGRISAWTNAVRSPTTGYHCNSVYHPMYPDLASEDLQYWDMLNAQGTTVLSFLVEYDTADALLPTWDETQATRRATIEHNAQTFLWPALDGLVLNLYKLIYFRVLASPACIADYTPGGYTNDMGRMLALHLDCANAPPTAANRFSLFVADLVYLCYARYGATTCDNWYFTAGNEINQSFIDADEDTANRLIATLGMLVSTAVHAVKPTSRFVWGEFMWRLSADSFINYLYDRRITDATNYLEYIHALAWHPYGGNTPTATDDCLDVAQNDPQAVLTDLQPKLDAITAEKGSSPVSITYGELSISAVWDDPRNQNWLNAIFSALMTVECYYCGIEVKAFFDDLGPYGFAHCLFDLEPYPLYYGQKILKETCDFGEQTPFCQCVVSDASLNAFAIRCPAGYAILIFNRRDVPQTIELSAEFCETDQINGEITQIRYEQSFDNPNVSLIDTAFGSYTNRAMSTELTIPGYQMTILRYYMADISLMETTVLQGHVFRQVHELVKLRAMRGWYVKPESGGHVGQHAGGAEMSVDVDPIVFFLDGVETTEASTTNIVVEASNTSPRIDVLSIGSDGTMIITKGTPAVITPNGEGVWQNYETPCTPDMSAIEGVILAEILVPAGATSIVDAYIRMLAVPVSITGGSGSGDFIAPATNTDGDLVQFDGTDSKTAKGGIAVVTTLPSPGTDAQIATAKAVRAAIYPVCTTIGTPGSDAQVPSEQAVREALPSVVTTIGTPGSDNDIPTEQAVREAIAPIVTTVGDPGADTNVPSEQAVREALDAISPSGGASFWTVFPGTPVRVGNTSFTNTDAANANYYNLRYGPGTIIKWEKSGGGFQCAKIVSATYSSDEVTYTIVGNTLAADFTDMKFCIHPVMEAIFIVPGNMPASALTNVARTIHPSHAIYIFSGLVRYLTASTTTGGTWDINDDAATIFTTKLLIAATAKVGTETICDSLLADATTAIAKDSELTLDYDSGHATTPGADAYVTIYYMPLAWRYRA